MYFIGHPDSTGTERNYQRITNLINFSYIVIALSVYLCGCEELFFSPVIFKFLSSERWPIIRLMSICNLLCCEISHKCDYLSFNCKFVLEPEKGTMGKAFIGKL